MNDLLFTVLSYVVALSILIAVHEFGHFWVARKLGVKVLRFSIGFGKPLWSRRSGRDQTEYVIAAVPLGGYVKMLDEREGEVPPEEVGRTFNRQPVGIRFAIAAAGPLFNFAFAIVAYWLMFVIGVPDLRPVVGEVVPGSVAATAGVRPGQEILSVGQAPTPTWGEAFERILPAAYRKERVTLEVREGAGSRALVLDFSALAGELKAEESQEVIGMKPERPIPDAILGEVVEGSAAEQAGLRAGDRITSIDGQTIRDWAQVVEKVRSAPEQLLVMQIERGGVRHRIEVRPIRVVDGGQELGRIGAGPEPMDPAVIDRYRAELRHDVIDAVPAAVNKTWDGVTLTLWAIKQMILGQMSVDNIKGPVTIAVYAKLSALLGIAHFLSFLAIVSVSLAVLNLLPVPVLDGGHLLYYVIEFIKGSPVSEQVEAMGQKVGIALIMALMSIALYNDLAHWVG